jgi:hypothetical protein
MKQFLGLILFILMLTAVSPLYAQSEGPSFSLQAISSDGTQTIPYFILDGVAGGEITGQVFVKNQGDALGTAKLYVVDAVTGQTGGTVLKMQADALVGTGSWIQLERDLVTLAPGEGQMVPFMVKVPNDARSGQHLGGIVMETVADDVDVQEAIQGEASFRVKVNTRTAVGVQINLPGTPVEKLDVLGLSIGGHDSQQIMYLNLRNSGTEMLKMTGSLQIIDAQGERLQNIRFNIDTFLPDNEISYPIYVEGEALTAGSYTADLSLRYGESVQISRQQLPLTVTEADNIQIFEGRDALASPLTSRTDEIVSGQSAWQLMAMGGLGLLNLGIVGAVIVMIARYFKTKKQRKQEIALRQNRGQRPLPSQAPIVSQRPLETHGHR